MGLVYIPESANWEQEKKAAIAGEKKKAMDMIKVASYTGKDQNPYPSPFLTLSDLQIPRTMTEIFQWLRYFYKFDPLIGGAINALATFPVTEVMLEDRDSKSDKESDSIKFHKRIFNKTLKIHELLILIGIDYFLYGNCFIFGEMTKEGKDGKPEWKTMTRLDPSHMTIDVDPATHMKKYKWDVPANIKLIVTSKKPKADYDNIPDIIKEAVRKKQAIVLNSENVYHFARPSESGDSSSWGTPLALNVIKLLMYRNVLRQAQEAIAREHIVPARIYYFEGNKEYNPYADFNKTAADFANQLNQSVRDPNHKIISPVPVGLINLGGEGKALMLTPEIEQIQSEILAGMNLPREFLFGGVSYSGSSISLRILENSFVTYRLSLEDFLDEFVIKKQAIAREEWHDEEDDDSLPLAKLADLKMMDDVQQKQIIINLNQAGKLPDEYVYNMIGVDDTDRIKEQLKQEMKAKLERERETQLYQLETQLLLQKRQAEMQASLGIVPDQDPASTAGGPPNQPPGTAGQKPQEKPQTAPTQPQDKGQGQSPSAGPGQSENGQNAGQSQPFNAGEEHQQALKAAQRMMNLSDQDREAVLAKLPVKNRQLVQHFLQQLAVDETSEKSKKTDMRPMPAQKPPRRNGGMG